MPAISVLLAWLILAPPSPAEAALKRSCLKALQALTLGLYDLPLHERFGLKGARWVLKRGEWSLLNPILGAYGYFDARLSGERLRLRLKPAEGCRELTPERLASLENSQFYFRIRRNDRLADVIDFELENGGLSYPSGSPLRRAHQITFEESALAWVRFLYKG